MSSVGSSDSSNASNRQDDTVRRTREESKRTEGELVKKQSREMRRINEQHNEEIDRLKQNHQTQMDDLRERAQTDINERDHKYQKEIEEVRGLYRKQLQGQMADSQKREEILRKTNSTDLAEQKKRNDARGDLQSREFGKGLQKRDEVYSASMRESREAQQEAINDNRERLQRRHELEQSILRNERDEKVGNLQNEYAEYRQTAQGQLRDQNLRHMREQQRASNNLVKVVKDEQMAAQDNQKMMRDGFEDALDTTRARFEKAASREREANELVRNSLNASAADRIDGQMSRLEDENSALKDSKIREQTMLRHQMKREMNNVRDAYQKNVDAYKTERDEAIRAGQDQGQGDLRRVHERNSKLNVANARASRMRQAEQDAIHRLAYQNLKSDNEVRHEQVQLNADQRVRAIHENATLEQSRMIDRQAENHLIGQQTKQDEMRQLREKMETDKQTAVLALRDQLQKQELRHNEKLERVVSKYEKQVVALKDQMVRDKKQNEENLKRVTDELTRAHKLGMDQIAQQNRERLRQANQLHSEEVRTINKRNEEKMDQVVGEIKRG